MAGPAPARGYRHWEEEMLAEYLATHFADCRVLTRVRLGPTPGTLDGNTLTPEERALVGNLNRRWADAMCVAAGTLYVFEASIIPDPRYVSLVLLYLDLIPSTPELAWVKDMPKQGVLVWAVDDAFTRALAVRHGLRVDVFKPSHFQEYLSVVRAREQRASKSGQVSV